jgi:hypothetical protein
MTNLTVWLATPDGFCPACRLKERPLWGLSDRVACASCWAREIPPGGSVLFRPYAQSGGVPVTTRNAA